MAQLDSIDMHPVDAAAVQGNVATAEFATACLGHGQAIASDAAEQFRAKWESRARRFEEIAFADREKAARMELVWTGRCIASVASSGHRFKSQ